MKLHLPLLLALTIGSASAQNYKLDDGFPEATTLGNSATTLEGGAMQAYIVPGGGSDLIRNISIVLTPELGRQGVPSLNGAALTLSVWDDPNRDGNPSDAVLLATEPGHVVRNTPSDLFTTYTFSQPVPVTAGFFIGYSVEIAGTDSAYASVDSSIGYNWTSYFFSNGQSPIDHFNLFANLSPPNNFLLIGSFLLRANDGLYDIPLGTNFCELARPNSSHRRGRLRINGNIDQATGSYNVRLTGTGLATNEFGYFLASQTQGPSIMPPGSHGTFCLGGPLLRIKPSISNSGPYGNMLWDVDPRNVDSEGGSTPGYDIMVSGQTWNFQLWYRDQYLGHFSNFTNGVSITLQ